MTSGASKVEQDLERFDQFNHQLFDLIDEIEQSKILDSILTIPSVVAAGDQTSGKSSVLGKLSGVPLPTGDGTVTLCATQLALRRSANRLIRMIAPETKDIADIEDICRVVNDISQRLQTKDGGGFIFDVMPRIRIENPDARNLTVVDLPGIIHSANKAQSEDVVDRVRDMALKHIQGNRTIILCVIDSTRDLALNKIFQLVNQVDPNGDRTVVVFTKIDKCLQDHSRMTHFLDQVKSQDYHTFKNHVFVNSLLDDDEELKFFHFVNENFGIDMANCTYKCLYSTVCGMLLKPVLLEFRSSWNKVENFRSKLIEERNRLPRDLASAADMASAKLTEFIEVSREALKGNFVARRSCNDLFFKYRQCFRIFKQEYQDKMVEVQRSFLMDDVAVRWRHQEMVNFDNWSNFKGFAMPIITSFLNPAIKCHNAVRNINKDVVCDLVWEIFDGQETHASFLIEKIGELCDTQEHLVNDRLHQMYEYEQYFYTDGELYEKLLERYAMGSSGGSGLSNGRYSEPWNGSNPGGVAPEPLHTPVKETKPDAFSKKQFSKLYGKKKKAPSGSTLTLNKIADDNESLSDLKAVVDAELEYTDEDVGKFYKGLESNFEQTKDTRHNLSKKMTYDIALKIMKELALDRICTVVPAQILNGMNEELQRKIQLIDRSCAEFLELPWQTTRAQMRRAEIDEQEALIRKWKDDFARVEKQINSANIK